MHEMSIASSIIEIVGSEAGKAGAGKVSEVELEIGTLSGIEYESLDFALSVMAPGTVIEGAAIVVKRPGGRAKCFDCSHEFETSTPINICPRCNSYGCNIVSGKELRVSSILIE